MQAISVSTITAKNCLYRVVGNLRNTDFVMNNVFWVAVFPRLTHPMLEFVAATIREFVTISNTSIFSSQPVLTQRN